MTGPLPFPRLNGTDIKKKTLFFPLSESVMSVDPNPSICTRDSGYTTPDSCSTQLYGIHSADINMARHISTPADTADSSPINQVDIELVGHDRTVIHTTSDENSTNNNISNFTTNSEIGPTVINKNHSLRSEPITPAVNSPPIRRRRFGVDSMETQVEVIKKGRGYLKQLDI